MEIRVSVIITVILCLLNSTFFIIHDGRKQHMVRAIDQESYIPVFYIDQDKNVNVVKTDGEPISESQDAEETETVEEEVTTSTTTPTYTYSSSTPPVASQPPAETETPPASDDEDREEEPKPEPEPEPEPEDDPVGGGPSPFGDDIAGPGG